MLHLYWQKHTYHYTSQDAQGHCLGTPLHWDKDWVTFVLMLMASALLEWDVEATILQHQYRMSEAIRGVSKAETLSAGASCTGKDGQYNHGSLYKASGSLAVPWVAHYGTLTCTVVPVPETHAPGIKNSGADFWSRSENCTLLWLNRSPAVWPCCSRFATWPEHTAETGCISTWMRMDSALCICECLVWIHQP